LHAAAFDTGLLTTTADGKQTRLTDAGLKYLCDQADPRLVLEDFVRVLEQRQAHAEQLIQHARLMADGIQTMKQCLAKIVPGVVAARFSRTRDADRSERILAYLHDWSRNAAAGQDCPLPELYRALTLAEESLTIGEFHDCLRELHARAGIYLHPWTGPLYTLPEPRFAVLVGHEVAYYASRAMS
jgi:hypothetical protein